MCSTERTRKRHCGQRPPTDGEGRVRKPRGLTCVREAGFWARLDGVPIKFRRGHGSLPGLKSERLRNAGRHRGGPFAVKTSEDGRSTVEGFADRTSKWRVKACCAVTKEVEASEGAFLSASSCLEDQGAQRQYDGSDQGK
ncbi:hypothetical protein BS17DRAFT_811242 [Gyrodon lividus]|nr:hypothetical protein BS17DRAFT_811242 [Gyrodon lividus]